MRRNRFGRRKGNSKTPLTWIGLEQGIKNLAPPFDQLPIIKNVFGGILDTARKQVDIQTRHTEALQIQVQEMTRQLQQHQPDLRSQVQKLSAELVDTKLQLDLLQRSAANSGSIEPDERTVLLQQLGRAIVDSEKWKAEAMERGNEAVSRAWQGSVDETVRREREKDAFVIKSLREEVEKLKAERCTSPA